ncbi:ammonia channel protein [Sulfuricella sp. T08]|uniref:ammonium transporter n=1 Tax=Sulfuricella sp. T08 TaxID=1632857 RepID=UPI000617A0E5|nr:ammonium transporter [Sulfuricella sp. T08]GAO36914.1 ammonia channel protein [Sulfuricella sp. T08]
MKRLLSMLALLGMLGFSGLTLAEEVAAPVDAKPAVTAPEAAAPAAEPAVAPATEPAAAPAPVAQKLDSGNTAWMLTSTALVLFMTIPGLALFYGGMVRKKNVLATLMQSFSITALITVIWMIAGYSIAFRDGGPWLGGLDRLFLNGMGLNGMAGTDGQNIPESVFMMFQMTFAIITPALITGAFADRMKFSAMLWFMAIWSLAVYAPIAHWVWGTSSDPAIQGWLVTKGVLDYAGGTVVHINAGIAGLVTAIVLGKRLGYGREPMAPHNLVLTVVGAAMLWVGWFGFNAGSAVAADGRAGMAMAVTQIGAAAAALSWMFAEWIGKGKPSVLGIASGAVAGLVAITPASGFVGPMGALIIGLVAGVSCFWGATSLKKMLGYDDSLDAFGVHGVGGIVGAILTGVFAVKEIGGTAGLLEGNGGQVVTQLLGVGATVAYSLVMTFIILKVIDIAIGLRVSEEEEREGLDVALHGEHVE